MKTYLPLFIAALTISLNSQGQTIPNSGFESWTNGSNSAPDGWQDHGTNTTGFNPVTQSTDHYLGNFAVKIENKISGADTTSGVIETKQVNGQEGLNPCIAVNKRYINLKGYYKFNSAGDSAVVVCALFKTGYSNTSGFKNILAFGWATLKGASVWTPFTTMDMFYDNATVIPDSAYISVTAYQELNFATGTKYIPKVKGNSVLFIDGLNFDEYLGVNQPVSISQSVHLFPTINNGVFDLNLKTNCSGYAELKIFDLNGRLAKMVYSGIMSNGAQSMKINASELTEGNYLLMLATADGYAVNKFIIRK
jgi:hypothetical protein